MSVRISLALLGLLAMAASVHAAEKPAEKNASQPAQGDIFPYKVHEDHARERDDPSSSSPTTAPGTVAYYTVVRTGSRDEVEPGHSGFAHFFEHMMFRGTDKYSKDAYNDLLKRMGADSNAFTSDDQTVYHIVGPASQLATMMDMESDRFKNLKYSEDGFRTEALAVLGEYNKSASNPFQPMFEKLRDLAYQKHTYKHTTHRLPGRHQGHARLLRVQPRLLRPLLPAGEHHPARRRRRRRPEGDRHGEAVLWRLEEGLQGAGRRGRSRRRPRPRRPTSTGPTRSGPTS